MARKDKAVAPTERDKADQFRMEDQAKFLDAWLDYCEDTPQVDWDQDAWILEIISVFEDWNGENGYGANRSMKQKGESVINKARTIKRKLLAMELGCPPIVGKTGTRTTIKEAALKHKSRLNKWS